MQACGASGALLDEALGYARDLQGAYLTSGSGGSPPFRRLGGLRSHPIEIVPPPRTVPRTGARCPDA